MANNVTITGIKAGTTTITASYTDGGVTKTSSVNFTVSKATGYLTATTSNKTYNGSAQTIATIATNSGTYYFGLGSSTTSGPSSWGTANTALQATNAGTYYVWAKCDTSTNYEAVGAKYIGTVTISQRTVTVIAPTVQSNTIRYTGSAQVLLSGNGSVTTGGTMYYYCSTSSTKPTFSTSTWSTTAPSKTDVGTYYIWYYAYVSDTSNNTGTNINTVKSLGSKAIEKRIGAAPTFSASSVSATCVQAGSAVNAGAFTAATAKHSGSITYSIQGVVKDGTSTALSGWTMTSTTSRVITVPASTLPGTYLVTVRATEAATTTDTSSYTDAIITVTLSKGTQSLTLTSNPTNATITYPNTGTITASGHAGTISASSGTTSVATVSVSGDVVTVTSKSQGTSSITVTAAATDYVNAVSKTVTWTVNRRTGAAPTFNASSVTATCVQAGSARTTSAFTAATAGHSGTISYSLVSAKNSGGTTLSGWSVDSSNRTIGIPANTVAGTYTVVVRATEAQTSTDTSSTKDATITVTLSKGDQTLTLNKTELALTVPNTGTITASGYAGTLSVSSSNTNVATASNAATSTITAIGAGSASNTTGTATITFTAAATDYVNAVSKTATVTVSKRTGAAPTFNASSVTATCVQAQSARTTSAFTAATAGHSGTISYSLVSAKNSGGTTLSGWSVSSGDRTIGIPANTVSGTYTVVVRATESATATDTSSTKDATITVTLSKGSQTLTLNKTELPLTVGGSTGTITASGYAGTLTVTSGTPGVATATNEATSTITAVKQGTSIITFTAAATNYVNEVSKTATVTVSRRTGAAPTFNASTVTATCSQDQSAKTTSAFDAATAGHSGTISYSLVSAKNSGGTSLSGWSVNSSNRTIGIPANTVSGTYTVVVRATEAQTDYDTSSTKDATITVTLSKGTQSLTLTSNPTNATSTYPNGGTITASGHAGTISASSGTTSVATVSVSGDVVTVTSKSQGTSSITVTAAATDYVNSVSQSVTWTVNRRTGAAPTFNASSVTATCVQSAAAVNAGAFTAATAGHSGSITYSIQGVVKDGTSTQLSGWTMTSTTSRVITVPASTLPGTYLVTVRATEAQTDYDTSSTKDAVITVTLSKGTQSLTLTSSPSNATSTYSNGGTITASGHAGTISASSATTSVVTVTTSGSVVTVACAGAGTSVITVTAAATDYVNAVSKTVTWTIAKANATLPTNWKGDSKVYHGTASLTATGATGGTLYYRYDTSNGTNWTETTTAPTRTALGSTSVQCKVVGDENHNDTEDWSSTVTLTITQASDARMEVTTTNRTYNGSDQVIASQTSGSAEGIATYYLGYYKSNSEATSESQITWGTANSSLSAKNAGTYQIYYKFTSDGNHSNNKDWTLVGSITIAKADRSGDVSCNNVTYGSTVTATVSGNTESGTVTWGITPETGTATINSSGVVTPTQAGTVTVTAQVAATSNYKAYTATSKTITISKADGSISYNPTSPITVYCTSSAKAASSTDADKTPSIATSSASSSTNTDVTIGYTISVKKDSTDVSGWSIASDGKSITIPSGVAAGDYTCTIVATAPTTTNYNAVSTTKTVVINLTAVVLSSITLTVGQSTITFGGATTAVVMAQYSNGSDPVDVTNSVSYSTDPTGIVTIS